MNIEQLLTSHTEKEERRLDALDDKLDKVVDTVSRLEERVSNHIENDTRHGERLDSHLSKMGDELGEIRNVLTAQHASLELHIKRTDLLEKKLEQDSARFEGKLAADTQQIHSDLKPLLDQQIQMAGFVKFAKVALKVLGIIIGIGTAVSAGSLGASKLVDILLKGL